MAKRAGGGERLPSCPGEVEVRTSPASCCGSDLKSPAHCGPPPVSWRPRRLLRGLGTPTRPSRVPLRSGPGRPRVPASSGPTRLGAFSSFRDIQLCDPRVTTCVPALRGEGQPGEEQGGLEYSRWD